MNTTNHSFSPAPIEVGTFVIETADRPCAQMVAIVTTLMTTSEGHFAECKYLSTGKIYICPEKRLTAVADFGVSICTEYPELDPSTPKDFQICVQAKKLGESKATYDDWQPRYWQPSDRRLWAEQGIEIAFRCRDPNYWKHLHE